MQMPQVVAHLIDPLQDPRWPALIDRHPSASVFHTRGWLQALQMTYGYEPVAITTSVHSEELTNALPFCVVRSWLTGTRLVSLPFSDHCEPLIESREQLVILHRRAESMRKEHGWKYVELRSANLDHVLLSSCQQTIEYCLHRLDLRHSLDDLFRSFHKTSVQQMIRRAERESLDYEEGRSKELIEKLHHILSITRRRHHLPPQPISWFHNLVECLGEQVTIRIVSKAEQIIAGILVMKQGKAIFYKYGGSDAGFNNLGGIQLLLWRTIQEAKREECEVLDFGRSDNTNSGLISFKERWSAQRFPLPYWHCPEMKSSTISAGWTVACGKKVVGRLPDSVLRLAGRLLYRHMG
jgi:hypothetical protein